MQAPLLNRFTQQLISRAKRPRLDQMISQDFPERCIVRILRVIIRKSVIQRGVDLLRTVLRGFNKALHPSEGFLNCLFTAFRDLETLFINQVSSLLFNVINLAIL